MFYVYIGTEVTVTLKNYANLSMKKFLNATLMAIAEKIFADISILSHFLKMEFKIIILFIQSPQQSKETLWSRPERPKIKKIRRGNGKSMHKDKIVMVGK